MRHRLGYGLLGLVILAAGSAFAAERLPLKNDWRLQSSAKVSEKGEALSAVGYDAQGWLGVTVPTTLLAALAANEVVPDPFYGDNLTKIQGYKPAPWLAMAPDSLFYPSWWYRTEFTPPAAFQGKHVVLNFDGINYRANIWLNGERIADDSTVVGMFRKFEFDVTGKLRYGEPNALAVEIIAPGHIEDKKYTTKQVEATTGWDDHNPQPPDLNAGIWEDVYLTATGPVALKHPYVSTDLDLPSLDVAHIKISVDAVNNTDAEQTKSIQAGIFEYHGEDAAQRTVGERLEQSVTLAPRETRRIEFTLDKRDPKLWWPHPVGPQNLYLAMLFVNDGDGSANSDELRVRFGVREVETYINDEGWRGYRVNGKNILIRGGAWMTADMLLRLDERRYDALVRYARNANLNMLRSEGFSIRETDEFYDLCDRYGIMVTQQIFGRSLPDEQLAIDSIRDMFLRIRNHPSLVHFLGHDETFPTETLDKAYRDMIAELTPERSYQPHSGAFDVDERFETGGTRTGTRELWTYAGPAHYYTHKEDGAWGFAQSGGIGGVFASLESMRRMMPEEALWPPTNDTWSLHTVTQGIRYFDAVFAAIKARYGEAQNIEDLAKKGWVLNYESARGMYEAYARNKYDALGITTWKYDAAWPAALTWQYVDWYLQPTGAYYGAQKACEPLHAQYSYDDHSVWVVNSAYEARNGLKLNVRVFNLDGTVKLNELLTVDVGPDGKTRAFVLDLPEGLTKTYFLRLDLSVGAGTTVSSNFYWLSTVPDIPGEKGYTPDREFYVKPKSTMDFTDLADLPKVELEVTSEVQDRGAEKVMRVTLKNPTPNVAFFNRLAVTRGEGGPEIGPIFWSENCLSLLPGESRAVEGTFYPADLGDAQPVVKLDGWNATAKAQ